MTAIVQKLRASLGKRPSPALVRVMRYMGDTVERRTVARLAADRLLELADAQAEKRSLVASGTLIDAAEMFIEAGAYRAASTQLERLLSQTVDDSHSRLRIAALATRLGDVAVAGQYLVGLPDAPVPALLEAWNSGDGRVVSESVDRVVHTLREAAEPGSEPWANSFVWDLVYGAVDEFDLAAPSALRYVAK